MRLSTSGPFDPAKAAAGVKRRIAAATGFPDFEAFTAALDEARKRVRAAFGAIVGGLDILRLGRYGQLVTFSATAR